MTTSGKRLQSELQCEKTRVTRTLKAVTFQRSGGNYFYILDKNI